VDELDIGEVQLEWYWLATPNTLMAPCRSVDGDVLDVDVAELRLGRGRSTVIDGVGSE